MGMRRAATIVALVIMGGCSDGSSESPEAVMATTTPATQQTTTTEPVTTTTTEPADPFAVPDDPADIDAAYVERVINEHNRIIGDALRIQLAGGDAMEIVDRYNAVFVRRVANGLLTSTFALSEQEIAAMQAQPGDPVSQVLSITSADAECIYAVVKTDYSAVVNEPPDPPVDALILRADEATGRTSELNTTGWISEGLAPADLAESTC